MKLKSWSTIMLVTLSGLGLYAQDLPSVMVDVNLDVKHRIGEVDSFDRSKFITIHSSHTETDWDGNNFTPNLRDHFLNGYDAYMGRTTGGITWYLKNRIFEDPSRPGHALESSVASWGQSSRSNYAGKTNIHPFQARDNKVLCAQFHPFWPDGTQTNLGWSLSQADTEVEPFGTATGEYMGWYIRHFFGQQGEDPPPWVEVINEPLWELVTNGNTPPSKVFDFHNNVAAAIRDIYPNILVGGYTAAFPDFDVRNFDRWHERDKLFIDMSGAHMDFISLHFYDFPAIGGKQKYRKGSNIEATFDMMEHYSMLSHGKVIPFEVSEYGAQTHDYNNEGWSAYRDWLRLKSINSQLMAFMERADKMLMTIPFTVIKAEWGRNPSTGIPYGPRLMRQAFEAEGESGEQWVYTDQVKFYQLWSEVKGTRIDTRATDPDFLSDAFVDGNQAYVIVNNLEFEERALGLNTAWAGDNTLEEITVKHLYLKGSTPVLDTLMYEEEPPSYLLGAEGTMVIKYSFDQPIEIPDSSVEQKYYANSYLKEISADTEITFQIDGVSTGPRGEAMLRLGLGRDHGLSLIPQVLFNDSLMEVPEDFRGGLQVQRDNFFGVIEIPVPYELLDASNTIRVTFPDNSGHVSSVALQTFEFSRNINRSEEPSIFNVSFLVTANDTDLPITGAELTFDSSSYVSGPDGLFRLDSVPEGSYEVKIQASGYESYYQPELKVSDNLHLEIGLDLLSFDVQIKVLEKELQIPVANAAVTAGSTAATTNSEGLAHLTLLQGESTLSIVKDYFGDVSETINIQSDTLIQMDLERLRADVKFRVSNSEGSRVNEAAVSVGDSTIHTNTLGLATFKGLKVDTSYSYVVAKEGFELYSDALVIRKDTTVELSLMVGIDEAGTGSGGLSLYPVPPTDRLMVSWTQHSAGPVSLVVTDVSGRTSLLLREEALSGKNTRELDLTDLAKGVYFISVLSPEKQQSAKFYKNQ